MAFGLGVAKGMLTTISHLVKAPVTIQYPEERLEMPIWTRGRPRLIYEIDTGELRCTACGACALACPVDVIKIEQHPSPIKGKILDRFDIDMAGCIECALCVEACPFRAITMAPDFEMTSTFDRSVDLVFDMYELRIAGTPEIDAGMEHIQGVKRGLQSRAAAAPAPAARGAAGPVAGQATGATAAPTSTSATGNQVAAPAAAPQAAVPSGQGEPTAQAAAAAAAPTTAAAPTDYDPLTISDGDLRKLPPADRALIYHARLKASGWTPPAAKS
ncbi:MAG TPA: NADH-quinone oxidoreductase subunit I [Chloroflexota bacterium]|jgi:formate hydrogenlyase subunit 6/NADH:ubiquinone oxidoreductase subunit I|nr:NADH-quinone oxidoreductase subunit I [Chloroflexota bacterium]